MRHLCYLSIILIVLLQSCAQSLQSHTASEPSRPHVVMAFMDGTNNEPKKKPWRNTHVVTTHRLADTAIRTIYIRGVGTNYSPSGTIKGTGTAIRVCKSYLFLTKYYKPGDSICLFGFSRGANQCRILSNLISTVGIMDLNNLKTLSAKKKIVQRIYKNYRRTLDAGGRKRIAADYLNARNLRHPDEKIGYDTSGKVPIELMALWETVEAFRIDRKEITSPGRNQLNQVKNVKKIFQALALDDNRAYTYTPVLLTTNDVAVNPDTDEKHVIEEVWFNGSHRDVGGGTRKDPYLQNISLNWMLSRLKNYRLFRDTLIQDYTYANVHDMRESKIFKVVFADTIRSIGMYLKQMRPGYNGGKLKIHESVIKRLEAGEVQDFKLKGGRNDWYDTPPFNDCFIAEGRKRILKAGCNCIEVVKTNSELQEKPPHP